MRYTVVLVTPPADTSVVAEAETEDEAVEQARGLLSSEGLGQFHMVCEGDRVLWTSESGELERLV